MLERLKFAKLQKEIKEREALQAQKSLRAQTCQTPTQSAQSTCKEVEATESSSCVSESQVAKTTEIRGGGIEVISIDDSEVDEANRSMRTKKRRRAGSSTSPRPSQSPVRDSSPARGIDDTPKTPKTIRPKPSQSLSASPPVLIFTNMAQQNSPVMVEQAGSSPLNSSRNQQVSAANSALATNPMVLFSQSMSQMSSVQHRSNPFCLPSGFGGTIFINPTIHVHMNRNEPDLSQYKEIKPKEAKIAK